jgi:hypothetical protein
MVVALIIGVWPAAVQGMPGWAMEPLRDDAAACVTGAVCAMVSMAGAPVSETVES